VTEIAPERNAFRVMATWLIPVGITLPPDLKVGSRVDVHVTQGPGPLSWVADSIIPYTGDPDQIMGRIDAMERSPDGTVRVRVLDTWIAVPSING
jgi:hypothetical protein